MYLAVDVGGTKTLLAVFDDKGQILQKERFATPRSYPKFLDELQKNLKLFLDKFKVRAVCAGLPGQIDPERDLVLSFGNEPWHNKPMRSDIADIVGNIPVYAQNDAKLAGLSEALLVQKKYKKVLYLTVSTGIGDGIIISGIIDPDFADSEAGQMVLEHDGKLQRWEDFASGRALKEQTGKIASELEDERAWYKYVQGLAQGIDVLVATIQPEVVIIGGGVGAHFNKFGHFLVQELKKYENNMIKMPPVIGAQRPEEAVIYGCYEYCKQQASKN
jgi:glucokinase